MSGVAAGAGDEGWRSWGCSDVLAARLGSIKQLHERVTQECAEYRALYEKMVLPPNMGPRVDWARVLEQKQVSGHPQRWRCLREREVTASSNRSNMQCQLGPDSTLRGLGRERAEDTVQSRKASCRRRLRPRGRGKAWSEVVRRRQSRRNKALAWGATGSGVLWEGRQNQIMGTLNPHVP